MEKEQPYGTIRVGHGVKGTIRPTEYTDDTWYTVEISRTYQDAGGNLQESFQFRKADLLYVAKAAHLAFDELLKLEPDSS